MFASVSTIPLSDLTSTGGTNTGQTVNSDHSWGSTTDSSGTTTPYDSLQDGVPGQQDEHTPLWITDAALQPPAMGGAGLGWQALDSLLYTPGANVQAVAQTWSAGQEAVGGNTGTSGWVLVDDGQLGGGTINGVYHADVWCQRFEAGNDSWRVDYYDGDPANGGTLFFSDSGSSPNPFASWEAGDAHAHDATTPTPADEADNDAPPAAGTQGIVYPGESTVVFIGFPTGEHADRAAAAAADRAADRLLESIPPGTSPQDFSLYPSIEALNRISIQNQLREAQRAHQQQIEADSYNPIAWDWSAFGSGWWRSINPWSDDAQPPVDLGDQLIRGGQYIAAPVGIAAGTAALLLEIGVAAGISSAAALAATPVTWTAVGTLVLKETGEYVFEQATGIPVLLGPDDIAELVSKGLLRRGLKEGTWEASEAGAKYLRERAAREAAEKAEATAAAAKRAADEAKKAASKAEEAAVEAKRIADQTAYNAKNASTAKIPTPRVKEAGKIADIVPTHVPNNWSPEDIAEAIEKYERSIKARKAEQAGFDAAGGGDFWRRKDHFERIAEEETFLRQLQRKFKEMR